MSERNDFLKSFAMGTMLIDHIGYMFFPGMLIFRTIGRMAFPIFAYMIACGYDYTHSLKGYIKRLMVFGIISQIPYSYFNKSLDFEPLKLNIFFTLALGLILINSTLLVKDAFKTGTLSGGAKGILVIGLWTLFLLIIENLNPYGFRLEYGWYGLFLIVIFYYLKNKQVLLVLSYILLTISHGFYSVFSYFYYEIQDFSSAFVQSIKYFLSNIHYMFLLESYFFQGRSIFSLVFIKSNFRDLLQFKWPRWVGYVFYPGHISLLILIKWALM